jgi:hypothetical protein
LPTVRADKKRDFRLNVVEGVPRYGMIAVSLTTRGDTKPGQRPGGRPVSTAPQGKINYDRTVKTSKDAARAIRKGEGVLVVHGLDYNNNGEYDFEGAQARAGSIPSCPLKPPTPQLAASFAITC